MPTPLPSLISMVMARDTTSLDARSLAEGAYLSYKGGTRKYEKRGNEKGNERWIMKRGRRGRQNEEQKMWVNG